MTEVHDKNVVVVPLWVNEVTNQGDALTVV